LHKERWAIAAFIGGPGNAGDVRRLRHLARHALRNINRTAIPLALEGDIRSERLEEDRDPAPTSDVSGRLRLAIKNSIRVQSRILIDLIQGRRDKQIFIERPLEPARIVLRHVSDLAVLGNAALLSCSFNGGQKLIEDIGEPLRV